MKREGGATARWRGTARLAAFLVTPLVALLALIACDRAAEEMSGPMEQILRSHPGLERVLDDAPGYRLQVVLGVVEEGPDGPRLVQHGFRLGAEYFYPASSVKLFAAVAALERLAELRRETGLALDPDTPLVFHPLFEDEQLEEADESDNQGGRITVGHEIRKLFLVSDNRAFNRLYELVGQDRLAACLTGAGLTEARIVHRLSEFRSAEDNRRFPRIDFVGDGVSHTLAERTSEVLSPVKQVPGWMVGSAYMTDGEKVAEPMDFAVKNQFPLAELQRGLCMALRPDLDCGGSGFRLGDADQELLANVMAQYPRQSLNPVYDPVDHPDDYVKLLLPGLERVVGKQRLRIFNKVGQAYGFTTENAWILDTETNRGFFLAATLYTNANGVLNDDNYEYETVALPFMADLGEAVARALWESPAVAD